MGRLEAPKDEGNYATGQLFLHKIFGYRGVVLFPWIAKVYDRDMGNQKVAEVDIEADNQKQNVNKEVQKRTHTYYQVLIDQRDCPFIRALQTEAVTFLGNQVSNI